MSSTSSNSEAILFDRVLLLHGDTWVMLTVPEFFELPLSKRIQHVIARSVKFQLRGKEVDQKEALAELRRMRATDQR